MAADADLRQLGAALRQLRERAGLSSRALAKAIGVSAPNISNWERAERLLSEERLAAILDAVQAAEDERERLLVLRRRASGPGELVAGVPNIGPLLSSLIKLEQGAREITAVAPLRIPGLLQTSEYARLVLGRWGNDVDTLVTLRMGRQQILRRDDNPVQLLALIEDGALVGPPEVMAGQLKHLLAMAELPSVTVRLVPSSLLSPMRAGPFFVIKPLDGAMVVHLEHYRASATLWDPDDVRDFEAAAEQIAEMAMTPAQTAEVMTARIRELEAP